MSQHEQAIQSINNFRMRPSSIREDSVFSNTSDPSTATSLSSTEPRKPLFPSELGVYRGCSPNTLLLAAPSDDPRVAHVQTWQGLHSRPDWTLFAGPDKWYREHASMSFVGRHGMPHIVLGSRKYGAAPTEKLECEGFYPVVHHFSLYLESVYSRERFEWRECYRRELREYGMGNYLSNGMKLVRIRTGQVVALYVKVICAVKKTGKIKFLGRDLGNEFQIMTVMTLLAIQEAEKRNKERKDWDWSGTTIGNCAARSGMPATIIASRAI